MGRILLHAVMCAALIAVAGCITYEQHTTFQEDGSGRVVVDTWVDYFAADEEDGEKAATAEPELEIGEEMGPAFASLEGVTIEENWIKMEGEGEDRVEHTRLILGFDDVGKLAGHGVFEDQGMSFEKKGKKYTFTQTITHEREEEEEETSAESEELARSLFEGYTFTYSVVMPGKIVETNGTLGEDGRTVTWEWPLYEFTQQEEIVMTAISKK
jgi:hypothetical protein